MGALRTRWILITTLAIGWVGGGVTAQAAESTACVDVNQDMDVNIADAVYLLNHLFAGGSPPDCEPVAGCGDANSDGAVNLADSVYLLNWLFVGGPMPTCPGDARVIPGFTPIGDNEQNHPEYTHDQTGIVFVLLPGGTFNMGSPDDGSECYRESDEGPVHEVELSPFLIAKHEVTQGQWGAVTGEYPSLFDGTEDSDGESVVPPDDPDQLPVERVSWEDIQLFEAETGLTLPTEAQWEFACRAGTRTAFYFGDLLSADQANVNVLPGGDTCRASPGEYRARPIEVGSAPPNGFGLHDMHGNVWEWCEDVYDASFYSSSGASGPDPLSTSGSAGLTNRGGCWIDTPAYCRSAFRIKLLPSFRDDLLGFRPAYWPLP